MQKGAENRWLVVNADDFGLHPDINRAIEQAHQTGILTSASLVACGSAFDQALQIVQRYPALDVGVHLTLVEERPLCPPAAVASLISHDGVFWYNYRVLTRRLLSGQIRLAEVRRELEAQVQRVYEAGLHPTHLDSHQHLHLLPGIWPIAVDMAHRYGIQWIRVPTFSTLTRHTVSRVEPIFRLGMNYLSRIRRQQLNGLCCAKHSPGLYLSGRLNKYDLVALLHSLPAGVSEIVTHPGFTTPTLQRQYRWNYDWTGEYEALVASKTHQTVTKMNIKLSGFSDILI